MARLSAMAGAEEESAKKYEELLGPTVAAEALEFEEVHFSRGGE